VPVPPLGVGAVVRRDPQAAPGEAPAL